MVPCCRSPYAHWGWNFIYYRVTYPAYGRYAAISGETYYNYTAGTTYAEYKTSTNYLLVTGSNAFGWGLVDNTSSYAVVSCRDRLQTYPHVLQSHGTRPGPLPHR